MDRIRIVLCVLLGLGALALAAERPLASLAAQQEQASKRPLKHQQNAGTPAPAARPSAYPVRAAADPAVVQRGRQIFSANCSFCHGSDARGGEGGPNLIRSELV